MFSRLNLIVHLDNHCIHNANVKIVIPVYFLAKFDTS